MYYVDTVGKIKKRIIQDIMCNKMSLFDTVDFFTGEKKCKSEKNPSKVEFVIRTYMDESNHGLICVHFNTNPLV